MDKAINISNEKKNVLEFDIEVEGIDDSDMSVRFIIEAEQMELGFDSKKKKGNTWAVEIPPLKILDVAAYPFHISVVVDGYAFEGIRGNVKIVGNPSVKVGDPKTAVLKPAKKAPKKVAPKKEEVKKEEPKKKAEPKKTETKKVEPKKSENKKVTKEAITSIVDKIKQTQEVLAEKKVEPKVPEDKKVTEKATVEEPKKEEKVLTEKKAGPKKIQPKIVEDKKVTEKAAAPIKDKKVEEVLTEKKDTTKKPADDFDAEKIASKLINEKENADDHKLDNMVKDILKEETKVEAKPTRRRTFNTTKPTGRKVIRGKEVVNETESEVDTKPVVEEKADHKLEDKVKGILNEELKGDEKPKVERKAESAKRTKATGRRVIRGGKVLEEGESSEDDKRTVTTVPTNKTFH